THEKYAINDLHLIPHYAVLDPELTLGLPPHITSTTGMDALTHAVEAYIGKSNTNETQQKALAAVKIVFENLEKVYNDGSDLNGREQMLLASHYAGIAFTRAYVGYVHAIAHNLGGMYGIAHGLANAIILPYVLEYYGKSAHKRLAELADCAGISEQGQTPEQKAIAFINEIKAKNTRMGIPSGFTEIKQEDIPTIARRAMKEGNPLYPVPKIMTVSECQEIIKALMA
ncbi:MAG: iron-containing alcohol dehydrogenase, partial [Clostridiales bacterium]|nr:iron-containing alcohol dehydrogenase [Clostridiales bacterium]